MAIMTLHLENDQFMFEVINHANITVKTKSGNIVKMSSKDFWTHFLYEPDGNNEPFTLTIYDMDANEIERCIITPQNMLGGDEIGTKPQVPFGTKRGNVSLIDEIKEIRKWR